MTTAIQPLFHVRFSLLSNGDPSQPPGGTFAIAQDYGSSNTFALTPTVAGTYSVGVWARSSGSSAGFEAFDVKTFQVTPPPVQQLPDLVASIQPVPSTGTIGDMIQLSASVTNQGTAAAGPFRLGFYFSTDATITTGDVFFAFCNRPGVAAGQSTTCSGPAPIPTSLSPGAYFVGAFADDQGVVAESNEGNNTTATGPITLVLPGGGGGGPQLVIPPGQVLTGCVDDSVKVVNAHAQTLLAFGGSPLSGYTWTLSNLSTFPAGTTVEPLTGIFKGTGGALAPGTHMFNMTVSDNSATASGTFTFTVTTESPCGAPGFQQSPLTIFPLPDATAGAGFGASLFVTLGRVGGPRL